VETSYVGTSVRWDDSAVQEGRKERVEGQGKEEQGDGTSVAKVKCVLKEGELNENLEKLPHKPGKGFSPNTKKRGSWSRCVV